MALYLFYYNYLMEKSKSRSNEEILSNNYKVYFYREKLKLLNKNDFKKYEKLYYFIIIT